MCGSGGGGNPVKQAAAVANPLTYVTSVVPGEKAAEKVAEKMTPKIPAMPEMKTSPLAEQATQATEGVGDSLTSDVQKRKLAAQGSTLMTGPLGLANGARIQRKTLLGS